MTESGSRPSTAIRVINQGHQARPSRPSTAIRVINQGHQGHQARPSRPSTAIKRRPSVAQARSSTTISLLAAGGFRVVVGVGFAHLPRRRVSRHEQRACTPRHTRARALRRSSNERGASKECRGGAQGVLRGCSEGARRVRRGCSDGGQRGALAPAARALGRQSEAIRSSHTQF